MARTAIADMPSRDVRRPARSAEKRNRDAQRVGGPPCRVLHPNQTPNHSHRQRKQSLAYIALIAAARRRRFRSLKIRSRLTDIRSGIAWLIAVRFPRIIMSSSMERNPIPRLPELLPAIFKTGATPALHIHSTARADSSDLHVWIIVLGQKRTYSGRTSVVAYSASNRTFRSLPVAFFVNERGNRSIHIGRQRLVCSSQNAVSPADISRYRLGEIHEQRVE